MMFSFSDLPLLNAMLNSTSLVLLLLGRRAIRQKQVQRHRKLMISVFVFSGLFLTSYLIYHYGHGSQPFQGEGLVRYIYFTILISHSILATAILPLAIVTLIRGLKRDDVRHKRIARWTYPIWLYVSVTGIMIYLMLYQLFPAA
jgi:uncharacterized membrane protein YozB (DUF420 family)